MPVPDNSKQTTDDGKDSVLSPPSSVLRTALTERPACFEIDPRARAVKQRLDVDRPRLAPRRLFRIDPLFTMSDNTRADAGRPEPKANGARNFISFRTSVDPAGGARRDRTDDLLLAKQALSQLSYGPLAVISDQLPVTRI
jgi:hypothetical protein